MRNWIGLISDKLNHDVGKKIAVYAAAITMGCVTSVPIIDAMHVTTSVEAATYGIVTGDKLNVRTGIGTSNPILENNGSLVRLNKGTKVTILSSKDGWYKVSFTYNGSKLTGYVCDDYIKKVEEKVPETEVTKTGSVTTNNLNVRTGAGTSYSKLTHNGKNVQLKSGTKVNILSSANGWHYVSFTYDSTTLKGYVSDDYVKVNEASQPTKKVGTVTATNLNVRTGAGTSYSKLTYSGKNVQLKNGTKVDIISGSNGWYKISFKYNNTTLTGYVASQYLKITTVVVEEEPTKTPTKKPGTTIITVEEEAKTYAKVTVPTLVVRKGAGTNYAKVKHNNKSVVLSTKNKVRLIGEKNVNGVKWYYIRFVYQGKTLKGYVHGNYLSFVITDGGFSAKTSENSKVSVKSNMSGKTMVRNGEKVTLAKGTKVSIVGQSVKNGTNWYIVSFKYGGSTIKGYLKANEVVINYKIKVEKEVEVTPTPTVKPTVKPTVTPTVKPTAKPTVTPTVKPTVTPTTTPTAKPTATPTTTPTAKPTDELSDEEYVEKLKSEGFPDSYTDSLLQLHKEHPNWVFKAYNTNLTWSTVITKQSRAGINLIPNSKNIAWKSLLTNAYVWKEDRFVVYDSPSWVTASKAIISYYMDPRNFLTEDRVFMYEDLSYNEEIQTIKGIEAILKNTPMSNTYVEYVDENGETVKKLYSQIFMEAAKYSGVSPYHLASRCKQEVVVSSTKMSSSVSGTVSGYEGYYNYYNIGASNSSVSGGAIRNGLNYAKNGTSSATKNEKYMIPWNNPYRAIVGGAYFIGSSYIQVGQSNIYLQKFNVTPRNTYSHQYMGNVEAAYAESLKVAAAYKSMDDYEELPIMFTIPVYNNMTSKPCSIPANAKNPNNWLKSLSVDGYLLTPTFDVNANQEYTITVDASIESININATTVSTKASITGIGQVNLVSGLNECKVVVTAENGDKREYILNVIKRTE